MVPFDFFPKVACKVRCYSFSYESLPKLRYDLLSTLQCPGTKEETSIWRKGYKNKYGTFLVTGCCKQGKEYNEINQLCVRDHHTIYVGGFGKFNLRRTQSTGHFETFKKLHPIMLMRTRQYSFLSYENISMVVLTGCIVAMVTSHIKTTTATLGICESTIVTSLDKQW